jgi:hypothetical protein
MTSGSVKSLKAYSKAGIQHGPELVELAKEIAGLSDRAGIIIAATYVEDGLVRLLSKNMVKLAPREKEEAFRPDGPLGSFSRRIEMSYLFKLIDKQTRDRLHDLREMRNACAHTRRSISLATPQLANVCKRFLREARVQPTEDTPKHLRDHLVEECFFLESAFSSSYDEAVEDLRKLREWLNANPREA